MELIQLLTTKVALYGETFDISLNWIGNLIRLLISAVGSVGVGIILFSLILKVIVMPFDVYQRINMRKQNQKMKDNQEKMEKLQKQYANNKEMYNQKVMEMYKESGVSVFSSCLPLILSMVIFIVAINAFNDYSQYASIQNYNTLAKSYNSAIVRMCDDVKAVDDTAVVFDAENNTYTISVDCAKTTLGISQEYIDGQAQKGFSEQDAVSNFICSKAQDAVVVCYETQVKTNTKFLWIKNIWQTDASYKTPLQDYDDFSASLNTSGGCGCSSCNGGIQFDVNGKDVSVSELNTNVYKQDAYEHITAKLGDAKSQANGYFILIVLSIATVLLQQWLSMRASKEQNKYGTVDGQGGSQQKMMMIIMTVMFALFSFLYSSAFSIYMIMSNVVSLFSTIVINKLVDRHIKKKEEKAFRSKHVRTYSTKGQNSSKKDKK